jgi:hypothetical protein
MTINHQRDSSILNVRLISPYWLWYVLSRTNKLKILRTMQPTTEPHIRLVRLRQSIPLNLERLTAPKPRIRILVPNHIPNLKHAHQ